MSRFDLRARLRMGPNLRSVRPRRIETTLALTSARAGPRPSLTISANEETDWKPTRRDDAPRCRGETRDPDDLGLWRGRMRFRGASGCAGERAVFLVHAECCQESVAWAVSLRAAQLLAGDSFTGRRSVAPLGASLAFGEIASERSRARLTEPIDQPIGHSAHTRGPGRAHTCRLTLCHRASPREHVPHHHDPRVTSRSTQAGLPVRSRPRDLRVNPWRAARASALPKQNGAPLPADLDPGGWSPLWAKDPEGLRRASQLSLAGRFPR